MTAKITLITPPDIYQNDQLSVLFIDITEEEQDQISKWLSEHDIDLNIYYYQGEPNVPWLLHAFSVSDCGYMNLNNMSPVISYIAGYLISRPGMCYNVTDENVAGLYSHINLNRVTDVIEFLERSFNGKE